MHAGLPIPDSPPILPSPRVIVFGVSVQPDGFIFIPIKIINAVDPSRNELTKVIRINTLSFFLSFFRLDSIELIVVDDFVVEFTRNS